MLEIFQRNNLELGFYSHFMQDLDLIQGPSILDHNIVLHWYFSNILSDLIRFRFQLQNSNVFVIFRQTGEKKLAAILKIGVESALHRYKSMLTHAKVKTCSKFWTWSTQQTNLAKHKKLCLVLVHFLRFDLYGLNFKFWG